VSYPHIVNFENGFQNLDLEHVKHRIEFFYYVWGKKTKNCFLQNNYIQHYMLPLNSSHSTSYKTYVQASCVLSTYMLEPNALVTIILHHFVQYNIFTNGFQIRRYLLVDKSVQSI